MKAQPIVLVPDSSPPKDSPALVLDRPAPDLDQSRLRSGAYTDPLSKSMYTSTSARSSASSLIRKSPPASDESIGGEQRRLPKKIKHSNPSPSLKHGQVGPSAESPEVRRAGRSLASVSLHSRAPSAAETVSSSLSDDGVEVSTSRRKLVRGGGKHGPSESVQEKGLRRNFESKRHMTEFASVSETDTSTNLRTQASRSSQTSPLHFPNLPRAKSDRPVVYTLEDSEASSSESDGSLSSDHASTAQAQSDAVRWFNTANQNELCELTCECSVTTLVTCGSNLSSQLAPSLRSKL